MRTDSSAETSERPKRARAAEAAAAERPATGRPSVDASAETAMTASSTAPATGSQAAAAVTATTIRPMPRSTQRSAYRASRSASIARATASPGGVRLSRRCVGLAVQHGGAHAQHDRDPPAGVDPERRGEQERRGTSETTSSPVSAKGASALLEVLHDQAPDPAGERAEGAADGREGEEHGARQAPAGLDPHRAGRGAGEARGRREPGGRRGLAAAAGAAEHRPPGAGRARRPSGAASARLVPGRGREQVAEGARLLRQRRAGALLHHPAALEHGDALRPLGRAEPVGDQQAGAAVQQPRGRLDHARLGDRVHARGRLVEHDDAHVARQQPRERDQLLLACREAGPARTEHGVEPVGQPATQSVRPSSATASSTVLRGTSPKSAMFSARVPARISVCWVTTPTAARSCCRSRSSTSTPPTRTVPGAGSTARETSEASVDLPEPVRPTSASVDPAGTARSTSRSANVDPDP